MSSSKIRDFFKSQGVKRSDSKGHNFVLESPSPKKEEKLKADKSGNKRTDRSQKRDQSKQKNDQQSSKKEESKEKTSSRIKHASPNIKVFKPSSPSKSSHLKSSPGKKSHEEVKLKNTSDVEMKEELSIKKPNTRKTQPSLLKNH